MMFNKKTKTRTVPVKREIPLIFFVAGLLLCVIIIVSFFPMTRTVKDDPYIIELEQRVSLLEKMNTELSRPNAGVTQNGPNSNDMNALNGSFKKLEGSLTLKSNLLSGRIDGLQEQLKELRDFREKRDVSKGIINGKKAVNVVEQAQKSGVPMVHIVETGDTFYSISRKYGISLQKLKKLNKFNEKTVLYDDQKIIVGP